MKKFCIILVLLPFLSTCTKFGRNVTVKGRVINPITGVGIEGAEVWLQRTTNGVPGANKTVKTATSDSEGDYELNKTGLRHYSLVCNTNGLYDIGWYENGVASQYNYRIDVNKGKVMYLDYYAVPFGELQVNIANVSCFDSNDKFELYFDGGPFDSRTFNPGLITTLFGCVNIPAPPVQSSMGDKYFHWIVTKNGTATTFYDTVFVAEGQISELNVNY